MQLYGVKSQHTRHLRKRSEPASIRREILEPIPESARSGVRRPLRIVKTESRACLEEASKSRFLAQPEPFMEKKGGGAPLRAKCTSTFMELMNNGAVWITRNGTGCHRDHVCLSALRAAEGSLSWRRKVPLREACRAIQAFSSIRSQRTDARLMRSPGSGCMGAVQFGVSCRFEKISLKARSTIRYEQFPS